MAKDSLMLGSRGGRSVRRWPRRLGWTVLVLGVVLPIAYFIFLRATSISPPDVPASARAAVASLAVEVRGPKTYFGNNWISRERGIWEEHLEGEPFLMGYAQSRLGSRVLREQEDLMFSEMARYVPSKIALFLIRGGVRLKYRNLKKFVPPAQQLEIAGLAEGGVDRHSDFLPAFHRILFYHALHDITQGVEHSPLLGCTSFAAAGPATVGGHLFVGRNFDFEGLEIFDREKAIQFYKPTGKIPFASVSWIGMSGVVTGLNTEGLFVSINAARTDDQGTDGMPVELLVRTVLEDAHSIDEAVAIIKKTPVMVPDFYLVADGKTGESAVIERSPTRTEVRRARDITISSNHALTPAFAGDAKNDYLRRYMTSGARHRRMEELVRGHRGPIDARRVLEILRDKKGPGGEPIGLGNRNALDALIATHSVVADATNLVLWVGEGPHLLGRYRAFDLRRELLGEDRPQPADLPEDPLLGSDEYRAWKDATASLHAAERLRDEKDLDRTIEEARRASALVERMPEPHRLLGDALRIRGDKDGARREYQRFLELSPPYLKDIEEVKSVLAGL